MLEPHLPDRPDDLKQRYLQASAAQAIGPSEKVRSAALAHAQAVAAGTAAETPGKGSEVAANQSRWNVPLVASLAIASISALLALQFDRGDLADKQVVLGTQSETARSQSALPALPPTPAPTPAQALPPTVTPNQPQQPAPGAPAAKRATPPHASVAQSSVPTTAKSGAAGLTSGSENMTADRSTSGRAAAPQSKAIPMPDTERSGQASARSESSSAEAPATMRSRPAAAAPAAPAPAAPSVAPSVALASPPLETGAALREAARTGQMTVLAQALQRVSAAELNSTDSAGRTALMLATLGGHVEAVQRLVNAGANTELQDASGQTAQQIAKRLGFTKIESVLKGS